MVVCLSVLALAMFGRLSKIWIAQKYISGTRISLYEAFSTPVLTYGCDRWCRWRENENNILLVQNSQRTVEKNVEKDGKTLSR